MNGLNSKAEGFHDNLCLMSVFSVQTNVFCLPKFKLACPHTRNHCALHLVLVGAERERESQINDSPPSDKTN